MGFTSEHVKREGSVRVSVAVALAGFLDARIGRLIAKSSFAPCSSRTKIQLNSGLALVAKIICAMILHARGLC